MAARFQGDLSHAQDNRVGSGMNDTDWWPVLFALFDKYHEQVLELPEDHSLVSPAARVVVQKRRLVILQQMISHVLETHPQDAFQQVSAHVRTRIMFHVDAVRGTTRLSCESEAPAEGDAPDALVVVRGGGRGATRCQFVAAVAGAADGRGCCLFTRIRSIRMHSSV